MPGESSPSRRQGRVVAVVVTRDRLGMLRECLVALRAQTRRPDVVVVVDNDSSDGTAAAVAEEFPEVDLLTVTWNTGGAGGFALGLERALGRHQAEHVWLLDDDCLPSADALAALLSAWSDHPGRAPAVVASRVRWTDGADHPMNTPRRAPFAAPDVLVAAQDVGCRPIRSASFVSILVDGAAARAAAPPVADFFLWNDDFEYTARLLRRGVGLWCPDSVVVHRTRSAGDSRHDPGARFYFEVRNKVWLFLRSRGLSPRERLLYGGSSVRRWARTFRHAEQPGVLVVQGLRGLRDGLVTAPRDNADVLAGAVLEPVP